MQLSITRVIVTIAVLAASLPGLALAQNNSLDQDSAQVCMAVKIRASISGLNEIQLKAVDEDGQANALYTGSDVFTIEANAPVRVQVESVQLHNGTQTLETEIDIDGHGSSLVLNHPGTHFSQHRITARARLGEISGQLAGEYRASVSLTVIPLIREVSPCPAQTASAEDLQAEIAFDEPEAVKDLVDTEQEADRGNERTELVRQIENSFPTGTTDLMNRPDAIALFPFLAEYLSWKNGETQQLGDAARYWWMFPDQKLVQLRDTSNR